ncbi:MAG: hypothetical protein CL725_10170 [Chloroflexi bacterium]|nr:hypothetical protein [Chloroflexota bacterium]
MPAAATIQDSDVRVGARADTHTSDWRAVQAALMRVGEHLQKPTRLVLIGSSVGMWYGQAGRMTEDVDVWSPKSKVDLADIVQACEKAGVHFDPKGYDAPRDRLYLQMVTPGVVHVGKWKSEESMFRSGNLEVVHPPAENVIASKLVRAEPYDLDDIVYLMSRLDVSMVQVRNAVSTLADSARERAEDNIVFLELRRDILADVNKLSDREQPKPARRACP